MLIDGRAIRTLDLKRDLRSLVSFESWLKENLTIYPGGSRVPRSHIISLLQYIGVQINEQKVKDKAVWKKKIEFLLKRASDEQD